MLCKPKPYYDEQNKVAIGYKNPLCLTRAKQVQPALYNGHEIIKTNHVPAIVHNSEDTLEIAEITRKKMNDKMKDPECVKKKVKIAPHDYSKENYLATFTPQKQLTPEQIFWSKDLIKMKAEALKEQTTTSRPIKALMMYPPNTPATLVPRVLLTKSQVKINIFALIQLFLEFEKTCKKRITPTGLTEGERGFEQTKECYLTEVIPFFKTLKEHFEGIQKALTKEIKEMKEIFEELEAEVDQNIVNRKHDEIEWKNILIANDNLIADCLYKEVFYIATNFELTVSGFTEMHVVHTVVQARCRELEAELSKLIDKVQKDDHIKLVKRFSNIEITQLTDKVTVLHEQNELFRTDNAKIKQHYKELYDSIKITSAKHIEQTTALLTENENLKAQLHENLKCITMNSIKPRVLATGVNSCTDASGSQPRINTKKNRILPAKSVNKKKMQEHPRTNKSRLKTTNRIDSSISSQRTIKLRIEQYFQVQDYALWDVIENGNSFKPVAQTITNADGTSTLLIPGPVTIEEKAQKKNDVKARSMLLMALPNEHLMTFNQYKDAKTLFAAIQTRFGERSHKEDSEDSSEENRNKPDLDTMSFDDLYNNFNIVKQEVKGTASSSSSSQNMAFMSSPSSTNEVNTAYGVSTGNTQVSPASTQVSIASTQVSTANLSDDVVYAFLANQPNGSQLVYEDLKQIHEDDIEEMDLKWQLALLSMRTKRFFQKTGRKITINGSDTAGYDKRTVNVEETSSKAMVAIDGAGFDWSYVAYDEVPTNMALIAFSDSEFNKSKFNLATYKRGLASVEEQLVFYKKNEVIFCKQLVVLKSDISYKDSKISMLKSELEKLKQEKESNQLKIENFDNASKSLDKLIGRQMPDKSRKGMGFVSYNAIPPPPTGLFSPPKFDLSKSGLEEFQQPEFEGYEPKTSKSVSEDIYNEVRESLDTLLVKELVSDDKLEKKTIFPTVAKIEFVRPKQQEKPYRKPAKYAKMYSFDHMQAHYNYHQRERVVSGNSYTRVNYNYFAKKTYPSAYRNMVLRAVLMKSGLKSLNTVRPVNTTHPKTIVYSAKPMSDFSKSAQSTVKRPYQIRTTLTNKNFSQKVNTAKGKFYSTRTKAVNTARPNSAVVNAVRANQGHPQKDDQGYVDSGCSRHMTGNMSYLLDFKEFDKGYVTFGGGAKGGKITAYESQVLLKVPRKNNMYSVDMKNIVPEESLTCLVAKATLDEIQCYGIGG
ncbi:hypothetical protein Tco_0631220 [Tanacetum coccineum]